MTQHHHTDRSGLYMVVAILLVQSVGHSIQLDTLRSQLDDLRQGAGQGTASTATCTQYVPEPLPDIRKPLSHKAPAEYHASKLSTSLTRSAEPWRASKSPTLRSYSTTKPPHQAVPERTRDGCDNSTVVRICPVRTTCNQHDLYPIGYIAQEAACAYIGRT